MLHGTLGENAEVIGTHPDMDSTNVPTARAPRPTHPRGGSHFDPSPAPAWQEFRSTERGPIWPAGWGSHLAGMQ